MTSYEHKLKNAYLGSPYEEYQYVEYIQSTGTQYIDTGFMDTPNTKISIDIKFNSTTTQQRMFGHTGVEGSEYMAFTGYIQSEGKWSRGSRDNSYQSTWQPISVQSDTSRHTFTLDNTKFQLYTNGNLVTESNNNYTRTKTSTVPITLLAQYIEGQNIITNKASANLYGCKIWDNNVLVRDFVPAYGKTSLEIGLYDTVNNIFYQNAGTGIFTKGPDVN